MDLVKRFFNSALKCGVAFSTVYIGLIVCVIGWDRISNLFSVGELNAVGDFMAGVLGPLSIFWVVLGYWQNQSALNEQAGELRKAVDSATKHLEVERRKIEPDLHITELAIFRKNDIGLTKLTATPPKGSETVRVDPVAYGENPEERCLISFTIKVRNAGAYCAEFDMAICGEKSFSDTRKYEELGVVGGFGLSSLKTWDCGPDLTLDRIGHAAVLADVFYNVSKVFYVSLSWQRNSTELGRIIYKVSPDLLLMDVDLDLESGFSEARQLESLSD